MKIPYGVSNFSELRTEGYFYVDKTPYLPQLEALGARYHIFLRPRRFGKSAFLSLLEHYYDVGRTEAFDALFSGLWIHGNTTPERNRYLILSLDFSQVAAEGGPAALRQAFLEVTKGRVRSFVMRYESRIPELAGFQDGLDSHGDPAALMANLLDIVAGAGQKMYVLIDEYDHFANRLLSSGAQDVYESLVQRTGFLRTFYAALKAGTTSGAISRMFITGVTPLLLDDLSSGFNIASHLSGSPRMNALAGFTHADVERALDELLAARPELAALPDIGDRGRLLEVLERHYDGYRFSQGSHERVFNADMVLYFLKELDDGGRYPTEMLDLNVRTDYRGLQRIGGLTGAAAEERRAVLETILGDGFIESDIVRQFGVLGLTSRETFISLLYYLGMLTLAGEATSPDWKRLEIPNRVIRELQWEHLAILLKEQERVELDVYDLKVALQTMAVKGEITPFLDLFQARVVKALGVKDLRRFDEKSLKLMLLTFISLSRLFHPLSEKEFAQGYCDLFLGVSPLYPAAKFAWLLELKYLPAGAKSAQIEGAVAQAFEQVARYAADERLVPLLTRGQALRVGALVFVGAQKVVFRPWPPPPAKAAKGARRRAAKRARKTAA